MQFTRIRSEWPEALTKQFKRDESGALVKTTSGYLVQGHATTETVVNMEAFADQIGDLRLNEALVYGQISSGAETAKVVTRDAYEALTEAERATTVARSNRHFS